MVGAQCFYPFVVGPARGKTSTALKQLFQLMLSRVQKVLPLTFKDKTITSIFLRYSPTFHEASLLAVKLLSAEPRELENFAAQVFVAACVARSCVAWRDDNHAVPCNP